MSEQSHLFLLGAGYSARRIGVECAPLFDRITGTSRDRNRVEQAADSLIHFDGETVSDELTAQLLTASQLVVSVPPLREGRDADPVLRVLLPSLSRTSLNWIGYLSTVGVYGNHDGDWVDEETECRPESNRSRKRLEAEQQWQRLADELQVPLAIFRLSGIYGPGRNALLRLYEGQTRQIVKPGQVFNRIHVDDLASAVRSASEYRVSGIYNITDDEPAAPQDVVAYAAGLMKIDEPEPVDWHSAELSPMARSFYGENKRVSNRKSRTLPQMNYQYPDYRTGLKALWESQRWRTDSI